jgi:hypothetical protein
MVRAISPVEHAIDICLSILLHSVLTAFELLLSIRSLAADDCYSESPAEKLKEHKLFLVH